MLAWRGCSRCLTPTRSPAGDARPSFRRPSHGVTVPRRSDYRHSYVATVEEALARFSVDQLKALVRLLPTARKPSRKAELTAEIERHLAGDLLRKLWARLRRNAATCGARSPARPGGRIQPATVPRPVRPPACRRRRPPLRQRQGVAAEPVPLRSRLPQLRHAAFLTQRSRRSASGNGPRLGLRHLLRFCRIAAGRSPHAVPYTMQGLGFVV